MSRRYGSTLAVRAARRSSSAERIVTGQRTHPRLVGLERARTTALIMNPPWESLRHAVSGPRMKSLSEKRRCARLLTTARAPEGLPRLYSAQGRGDRNLYKAFVELAPHLLCHGGRLVALVPGAWSSDLGTAPLRRMYLRHMSVEQWTSFENLRGYFPIDGRYKFGVLVANRAPAGTVVFRTRGFAADAVDLQSQHVNVDAADLQTLGGPADILPDLVSSKERDLLLRYREHGHPLFSPPGRWNCPVRARTRHD